MGIKGQIPWNKNKKGLQVAWNKGNHWSLKVRNKIRNANLGRKHTQETKNLISLKLKGRVISAEARKNLSVALKGKKKSESHRIALSEARKGKIFNGSFRKGHLTNVGRKKSEETKRKIGNAQMGEKNHGWKGGITSVRGQIRQCYEYRQWRSDVFTRDNYTCMSCGVRGGRLEADHYPKLFYQIISEYNIKSLNDALACEELWNINNGRTLCVNCHNITKRRKYGAFL